MAIITSELLSACGVRPEDKETRAKAALEKKYGKPFEIAQIYSQKFGETYYDVQAYAADEPDVRFTASIDTEDDNISDNYVERLVCGRIAQTIEKNLDSMPGEYLVFVDAQGPQPKTDKTEISIAEYYELDSNNIFQVEVYLLPEKRDAHGIYHSMRNALNGLGDLNLRVRLYVVDDEQLKAVQAYCESNDGLYFDYKKLVSDYACIETPYQNSKLDMEEDRYSSVLEDVL